MSNAKHLFKCNSSRQHGNNQNYEYISYGNFNNTASSKEEPMSSTAIFSSSNKYKCITHLQDISVITHIDEASVSDEGIEVEKTRNQLSTIHSVPCNASPNKLDCDDTTILQHDNSSFSNVFLLNSTADSSKSFDEKFYLQSTKITNTNDKYSQCDNINDLESPVSSSTLIEYSNLNIYHSLLINLMNKLKTTQAKYVCAKDYEATFIDDISVTSGDLVEIVKNCSEEWVMVRVASNFNNQTKQGYIPREIVCEVGAYINYLNSKISLIKQSKTSLVSIPVNI